MPDHCAALSPHSQSHRWPAGQPLQLCPQLSQPWDLASLLGCGLGLMGALEQCQAPYQRLIPAWQALGLPFSETPALILTQGMLACDSALSADRAETISP